MAVEQIVEEMDLVEVGKQASEAAKEVPVSEVSDKKEEVKEEALEEKEEVAEEDAKADQEVAEEETPEEPLDVSDRVQARIDALIERQIEKDKKIELLEKRIAEGSIEPKKEEPKYTKNDLLTILNDPAQQQFHAWANDQLMDIKLAERDQRSQIEQKLEQSKATSYALSVKEFPDMLDATTPLWQKANEIYAKKGLINDPDGQYIAAVLADRELKKGIKKIDPEILEKRLARETGKRSLASSSKKVVTTAADLLDKMEKAAYKGGSDSPEMLKYLSALEKSRLARKKA